VARIREYQPRDFEQLCELDRICFPPAVAYRPEEIAAALLQPRSLCFVAEQQGLVVGFILLDWRRAVGHIITIDLHPDYRRRGLGRRLMEMAEQRLRRRGVRRMVLEVATTNPAALAFYNNQGFAPRRLLPRYYRDGTDACLMEKAL
jgi:ribosomal-protein-alanine N-acetyltransferase